MIRITIDGKVERYETNLLKEAFERSGFGSHVRETRDFVRWCKQRGCTGKITRNGTTIVDVTD